MKRIISAALALVLIASTVLFASCESKSAQDTVNESVVKAKTADAYEASLSIVVAMHYEGDDDEIWPEEIHVVKKGATGDKPEIVHQRTMYFLGMPFAILTYTDSGEWGYVATVDSTYKTPYEGIAQTIDTKEIDRLLFKFPPMVFENAGIIRNDDGSTTYHLDVEKNLFHELYGKLLDTMKERMEVEDSRLIRISNARVEITLDDGNLRDYDIFFDMASDGKEFPKNASVTVELDYLAFGDDVVLTPPEGYLDFPLVEDVLAESESESAPEPQTDPAE
ncbi:MAG: hypothetical protein IJC62_04520 [Clostridia bacterium]|nr:hypothetical protein [Clostridia bacterium]